MRKVERLIPKARCLMVHRENPHVSLWKYDNSKERFYNVYSLKEFFKLILKLKQFRKSGYTVFGLQMAPGSLQGFFFHLLLKKLKALDFIVDFNLINADIITPPEGDYILDLHLNQIKRLLKIDIPREFYRLELPLEYNQILPSEKKFKYHFEKVGIHPWSRRGHLPCFVWPFEKWLEVIKYLIQEKRKKIIVFGKDRRFDEFKSYIQSRFNSDQINFAPCNSVKELIEIIKDLDLIISVNTGVIHIGYALNKRMIILYGPSLDIWTPKAKNIFVIGDEDALFVGSDRFINDERFANVEKIKVKSIIDIIEQLI